MREIALARSAGFCYGVRRAVELAEEKADQGVPCVMLGSIIHNRDESFSPETTTGALHHPAIASTSGWSGAPTITGRRPRRSA